MGGSSLLTPRVLKPHRGWLAFSDLSSSPARDVRLLTCSTRAWATTHSAGFITILKGHCCSCKARSCKMSMRKLLSCLHLSISFLLAHTENDTISKHHHNCFPPQLSMHQACPSHLASPEAVFSALSFFRVVAEGFILLYSLTGFDTHTPPRPCTKAE